MLYSNHTANIIHSFVIFDHRMFIIITLWVEMGAYLMCLDTRPLHSLSIVLLSLVYNSLECVRALLSQLA